MIPICTEIENLIRPVQLREDEYINESGLICCSKCRTPNSGSPVYPADGTDPGNLADGR